MPNLGERVWVVKKASGSLMSMRNQVCPCIGPLTSVAKLINSNSMNACCEHESLRGGNVHAGWSTPATHSDGLPCGRLCAVGPVVADWVDVFNQ